MHGEDAPAWAHWLEATTLAAWAREGLWLYPIASVLHILGIGLLLGAIIAFDLRVLGLARTLPLATGARLLLPLARAGFALALLSGLVMLAADATHLAVNPAFQAKAALLGLALLNVLAFHRLARLRPEAPEPSPAARTAALVSLLAWPSAATAGRLIAYF